MRKSKKKIGIAETIVRRAEDEGLIPWVTRVRLVEAINTNLITMLIFGISIGVLFSAAVAFVSILLLR